MTSGNVLMQDLVEFDKSFPTLWFYEWIPLGAAKGLKRNLGTYQLCV